MSNKMTIRKTDKLSKKDSKKNDSDSTKRRFDPAKYVPVVVVIALWILFFFYMG